MIRSVCAWEPRNALEGNRVSSVQQNGPGWRGPPFLVVHLLRSKFPELWETPFFSCKRAQPWGPLQGPGVRSLCSHRAAQFLEGSWYEETTTQESHRL